MQEWFVQRLFGFLVLFLFGAGGILFLDFNRAVQKAKASDEAPPSFQAYLGTAEEKILGLIGSSPSAENTNDIANLMPRAPDGWTRRPLAEGEGGDIEGFLPRSGDDGDTAAIELVTAIGRSRVEYGATVAIQTYERDDRRVVIQLVRLSDTFFTDRDTIDRRHDLQVQAAELRGQPFLTVRGLDVTEELLGDGMRARYFTANIGAQLQIRMLASLRLDDEDLVPLFETLDVAALNAAVVDRQPGLGEIPVLVLGSALSEADRAAYEADRAARAASAILRAGQVRDLAKAELAAAAEAGRSKTPRSIVSECRTEAGGIKRCSVTTDG
jgi:hypothetical protein